MPNADLTRLMEGSKRRLRTVSLSCIAGVVAAVSQTCNAGCWLTGEPPQTSRGRPAQNRPWGAWGSRQRGWLAPAFRADELDGWLVGADVEAHVVITAALQHCIPNRWIRGYHLAAGQI